MSSMRSTPILPLQHMLFLSSLNETAPGARRVGASTPPPGLESPLGVRALESPLGVRALESPLRVRALESPLRGESLPPGVPGKKWIAGVNRQGCFLTFPIRAAGVLVDLNRVDLNRVHPFREENGRTQRVFMRSMAQEAGTRSIFPLSDASA